MKKMAVSEKNFYEDVRLTLMLYKIIGLTSLKNIFSGRLEFRWGLNFMWPVVCIILKTLINIFVIILLYQIKIFLLFNSTKNKTNIGNVI